MYAAINRHLSDIEPEDIKKFERDSMNSWMLRYRDVGSDIKKTGQLSEGNEERLKEAIELFKKEFKKDMI